MKLSFQNYKSQRELVDFDCKISDLCEAIVNSGIGFDVFWEKHALPILLSNESHIANDEELLNELWNPFRRPQQNMEPPVVSNPIGRSNMEPPVVSNPIGQSSMQPPIINPPQSAQANPNDERRQQKLAKFQQKADQQINSVKQRFQVAMKDFLKAVTDDAKSQNDPHMWQIAKAFHQKLMAAAQPVIDQFKLNAKFGKASYTDKFSQEAGQMQGNKRNDAMQALRQRAEIRNQQFPNYAGGYFKNKAWQQEEFGA